MTSNVNITLQLFSYFYKLISCLKNGLFLGHSLVNKVIISNVLFLNFVNLKYLKFHLWDVYFF